MKIFPAIDLREGNVVRLVKGDYSKETVYSTNPLDVAREFEDAGAEYLHVVDLDGAINGKQPNFAAVEEIIDETSLKVEIGGGIRSEEIVVDYAKAGALRVIIATAAVEDPLFTAGMIKRHRDNIAVGIDIVGTKVATHGWTKVTDTTVDELIEALMEDGLDTVICTDIARDGAMNGTNLELYRKLVKDYGDYLDIVACGGICTMDELHALEDIGVNGAIIGRAFYIGALDPRKVLEEFSD